MNRKMMLVLVALVATVLPAVAVADVMVVGFSGGNGHQVGPAFYIQPGSNYLAANETVGFGWHQDKVSSTEYIGNITIGYITNETIYEINVLDINFTNANYGNLTILVNITAPFPSGSVIYLSNATFVFVGTSIAADPPGGPATLPPPPPPPPPPPTPSSPPSPTPPGSTTTSHVSVEDAYLNSTAVYSFTFDHVHKGDTIYMAFELGSGSLAEQPSFTLTLMESF
ncbi:MAG: hypothetical protein OWQ34_01405 [Thermoplasma acidophilum]|nr:hypothetical protein [Thermoplasma acidophilum]